MKQNKYGEKIRLTLPLVRAGAAITPIQMLVKFLSFKLLILLQAVILHCGEVQGSLCFQHIIYNSLYMIVFKVS